MTRNEHIEKIRQLKAKIRDADGDDEVQHIHEDAMLVYALRTILNYATVWDDMAIVELICKEALETQEWKFSRWYA